MSASMRPARSRRLAEGQTSELVVASRDGTQIAVIYETSQLIEAPNWTRDGRWLIYNADGRIFRISTDGQDGPHRINTAPVENLNNDHVLAPDGERIYLTANDGHLYVCPLDGGVPERVSNDQPAVEPTRYYPAWGVPGWRGAGLCWVEALCRSGANVDLHDPGAGWGRSGFDGWGLSCGRA